MLDSHFGRTDDDTLCQEQAQVDGPLGIAAVNPRRPALQFSLTALVGVVTSCCIFLGLISWLGLDAVPVFFFPYIGVWIVLDYRASSPTPVGTGILAVGLLLGVSVLATLFV